MALDGPEMTSCYPRERIIMDRITRLACTRGTYIVLLIAAVAFFFIGNLGGKQGNPSWLLAPVCIIVMIVLGITAFVQTRRTRSASQERRERSSVR
jgi:uncharacterized membrane protein SirB2